MKTLIKAFFVSAVTLSVVSPAFAYQTQVSKSGARIHHVRHDHNAVRAHRGIDANAYAPADVPVGQVYDFGIGGADSGGAQ